MNSDHPLVSIFAAVVGYISFIPLGQMLGPLRIIYCNYNYSIYSRKLICIATNSTLIPQHPSVGSSRSRPLGQVLGPFRIIQHYLQVPGKLISITRNLTLTPWLEMHETVTCRPLSHLCKLLSFILKCFRASEE